MASTHIRFLNFIIDTIIYFLFLYVFLLLFNSVIPIEDVKWYSIAIYFFYYFLFELLKKQTVGKIITKTKVVVNSKNEVIAIFFRTLIRFFPLDILSYLFSKRGFHDVFTCTNVIEIDKMESATI